MKKLFARTVLSLAVAGFGLSASAFAESPFVGQNAQAQAQALQTEAIKAIRAGEWTKTSELISKAAAVSNDPSLAKMSQWLVDFESQRQTFAAERRKQYDSAVDDVKKLIDAKLEGFAIDAAARAYVLADDKTVFHNEPWVQNILSQTISLADAAKETNNWYTALRFYSDLAAIEPSNSKWRGELKGVMRRIQLLATYAPDVIKDQQEAETKLREAADKILKPTTQPSTQPTTKPVAEINESFKIEWRDTVKGIENEMLRNALRDARRHYWKDVTYRELLTGGLEGMRVLATTPGLEAAFPNLKDPAARDRFVAACNELISAIAVAKSPTDDALMTSTLTQLYAINRRTIALPEEVFTAEFAVGAFSGLDDFTNMIWPYDVEEFNKSTQGEFQGIGIQIDTDEDGGLKVVSPIEDTPAYRAGIKAGDVITHINGKNAKGITITQAIKNITGPENTTVRITVRSLDNTTRDLEIKRAKIMVASIKGWIRQPGGAWDYFVDKDSKIGYIRMTNFTKTTSAELKRAVDEMENQGARAMILDLRYNPGGLLNAATEVSDHFLNDGTIVSTKSERRPQDEQVTSAESNTDDVRIPMVVLVNQYSASASEIVSGALRDQKRALVVGERTFGKGSVQMLFQVDGKAAYLKLTTSHYYLPNGECIHKEDGAENWGVQPDVTVSMTNEQMLKANKIRSEQDILRDIEAPTTQPLATADKKTVLDVDPQLSTAVLLLRLQLAGAKI